MVLLRQVQTRLPSVSVTRSISHIRHITITCVSFFHSLSQGATCVLYAREDRSSSPPVTPRWWTWLISPRRWALRCESMSQEIGEKFDRALQLLQDRSRARIGSSQCSGESVIPRQLEPSRALMWCIYRYILYIYI